VKVSVVVPTWNGHRFLEPCLEALGAQSHRDLEVVVVDNGSTDGSRALLAARFPTARVVAFPQNRGFSVAVNAGIRASAGEVVALLNNDTRADPDWIAALVDALARHPEIGFCASRMLRMDDPRELDNAGIVYRVDGLAATRGARQLDGPAWRESREIFGACAGAAAYRRALFDAVGLFDERYFAYHEDTDLSFRAQLRGFRCLYVGAAVVHHHRGGSAVRDVHDVLVARNRALTWIKNMPAPLIARHPLAFPRGLAAAAWSALRLGRGRAYVSGLAGTLRLLGPILADRARVQRGRTVSIEYLTSLFANGSAKAR
jgi:GT2 family glycosyltransferase